MKFTFRTKLFIYFVEIILFTSIPIAIITYNYSYNSLEDKLVLNAQEQMAKVDIIFSNMIRQMKADTNFLSKSTEIKKADQSISALFNIPDIELHNKYSKQIPGLENSIYNQFEFYGETHQETKYVYIGTKWGGYIQWPDGLSAGKFDPRERPWYKLALRNPNQVAVTDPYISAIDNSKSVIISTAKPIKDASGDVVGVVGIDVSLETLSQTIRSIKIGNTGYAFLFLKDGTVLAHPNADLNFKNIMQLNELGYTANKTDEGSKYSFENYNKFIDRDNSTFETNIEDVPVIVNIYTSPYTGWKMASIIPKSELAESANKIGYIIALVTFGVFLFVILITIIITRKLTKPITELTPLMNAAGNGDFTVRADIKTNDEFGQLGNSFNLMIGQLSSNYDELSAVYEELLATEEELKAQYDELQENEEALKNSEERYRLALECANDSIWDWNLVTDEFFVSDKIYDIIGYKIDKSSKVTEIINELVHPNDLNMVKKDFKDHINNINKIYLSEFRAKTNDGSYVWISSRGKAIRDSEDKVIKLAGSITDISNRKITEDKIKFMAYYDSLTKLPNRTTFLNILNGQLESLSNSNVKGAVFFIDLDNFKNINDTLGHDYGDKLLVHLAKKFESFIEENDTICRLGGDEFILLHPYDEEARVEHYARRLLELFKEPFKIDDRQIYSTASIGVALYPKDGIDTNTILKNADSAMYKAKELGKNRYMLFDPEMYLKLERKICIERILRTSIENNELSINYQPQYNAQNSEIFGFEALVRLNSKELGFISPLEFIPIAEECGFITKLGKWVLRESCKQSVAWFNAGYKFKSMSINISSVDLQQLDFLQSVKDILEETSINPNIVELEITETVLMQSLDASIEILKKLMDMGIRIALDDFGTGYSSLSYLRKIPISTLKIDKSFIDNITSNKKEEAIINNIIQMAHSMDLKIVAEGVEIEEQLSILKERKCDYIQGYYFSKPLIASEIEKLLEKETKIKSN